MSKARGPYRVDPLGHKKSQQALDKMAENARELGLDYEPAQQEFASPGGGYVPAIPAQQPAQRTWVGLTEEEFESIEKATLNVHGIPKYFGTAIEAKLKEKNT